jgi:hypothetical protein
VGSKTRAGPESHLWQSGRIGSTDCRIPEDQSELANSDSRQINTKPLPGRVAWQSPEPECPSSSNMHATGTTPYFGKRASDSRTFKLKRPITYKAEQDHAGRSKRARKRGTSDEESTASEENDGLERPDVADEGSAPGEQAAMSRLDSLPTSQHLSAAHQTFAMAFFNLANFMIARARIRGQLRSGYQSPSIPEATLCTALQVE